MTARELGFIKAASRGLRLAQEHLSSPNAEALLAEAIEHLFDDMPGAISNHDIAYFAAMLIAWQDRGSPDLFT